ncbi:MAG: helix-hairpin-helix domain-containing protein [Candidatus Wallbacteria bacterium]|nr:helix-hairpin-helix domain-containing protein [Candidatus Wallbacteria bacterium]
MNIRKFLAVMAIIFISDNLSATGPSNQEDTAEAPITIIESESQPVTVESILSSTVSSALITDTSSVSAPEQTVSATILSSSEIQPVPSTAEVTCASTVEALTNRTVKVNINTAQLTDLCRLPGVDPVLAAAIIDYRTGNGNFLTLDDLLSVKRINKDNFLKFRKLITLSDLDLEIKIKVVSLTIEEMIFLGVNPDEAKRVVSHFRKARRDISNSELGRKFPSVLEKLSPYLVP